MKNRIGSDLTHFNFLYVLPNLRFQKIIDRLVRVGETFLE